MGLERTSRVVEKKCQPKLAQYLYALRRYELGNGILNIQICTSRRAGRK